VASHQRVEQAVANANVNLPTARSMARTACLRCRRPGSFTRLRFRPLSSPTETARDPLERAGARHRQRGNDKLAAWFKDQRGIILAIYRQPGTNTIEVVDAVKKLLPTFRVESGRVSINVMYDRSTTIRESVETCAFH